jgi:hypothetical protein
MALALGVGEQVYTVEPITDKKTPLYDTWNDGEGVIFNTATECGGNCRFLQSFQSVVVQTTPWCHSSVGPTLPHQQKRMNKCTHPCHISQNG